MELTILHQLAIALGLGFLVGLQREWASKPVAGIRTFPIITLVGALTALLAGQIGGWILGAGLLSLAAVILVGHLLKQDTENADPGITTEVAALLMYVVGAVLVFDYTAAAVAISGTLAVLLHWKRPLHELVRKIGDADFRAIMRLVLLALVILPVLPNEAYGPYQVLNPFEIWLMVVLIVGISLGAYVAYKLLGARVGTLLAGVLGGLISSTATTISYARWTRRRPSDVRGAALVLIIASTIVFVRVLLEIGVVAPQIFFETAPPLITMMMFMFVLAGGTWLFARGTLVETSTQEPPSDIKAAITFGVLYAAVLLGVAVAKHHFGSGAMYGVAALSGLTDMDAITLSTAQLVNNAQLEADTGWRLILVGALANLVFKALAVGVLGRLRLFGWIAAMFGIALAGGGLLLWLWP